MITKEKCFDLLSNSLNLFCKEMYGDQFGEFVCGYLGLKGQRVNYELHLLYLLARNVESQLYLIYPITMATGQFLAMSANLNFFTVYLFKKIS